MNNYTNRLQLEIVSEAINGAGGLDAFNKQFAKTSTTYTQGEGKQHHSEQVLDMIPGEDVRKENKVLNIIIEDLDRIAYHLGINGMPATQRQIELQIIGLKSLSTLPSTETSLTDHATALGTILPHGTELVSVNTDQPIIITSTAENKNCDSCHGKGLIVTNHTKGVEEVRCEKCNGTGNQSAIDKEEQGFQKINEEAFLKLVSKVPSGWLEKVKQRREKETVICPNCKSTNTEQINSVGYQCHDCCFPFFKNYNNTVTEEKETVTFFGLNDEIEKLVREFYPFELSAWKLNIIICSIAEIVNPLTERENCCEHVHYFSDNCPECQTLKSSTVTEGKDLFEWVSGLNTPTDKQEVVVQYKTYEYERITYADQKKDWFIRNVQCWLKPLNK